MFYILTAILILITLFVGFKLTLSTDKAIDKEENKK